MKEITLKLDYLNGPIWKDFYNDETKIWTTGIELIDNDDCLQSLDEKARNMYSSLYSSNKVIKLFDELVITVGYDDWMFLCEHRFGTDTASYEDIQAEFVTGTGITPNKRNLWPEAETRFTEYINELREINSMDINKAARELLN